MIRLHISLERGLPRSIYDSNSETDLTGVAPADGTGVRKHFGFMSKQL